MRAWLGTRYSRIASPWVRDVATRLPPGDRRRNGWPTLHLTFDDGPTDETPALLDVLADHNVRATFYLLGENARRWPRFVRAIVEAGHRVGNHSFAHLDAWRTKRDELERDLAEATAILEDLTGGPITTMRPPFGRLNRNVVRWARANGQRIAMWDLMPPDFERGATPARVARTLVRGIRPGSIVVLHDNAKSKGVTTPALRLALPRLQRRGCVLLPPAERAGRIATLSRAA